MQRQAEKDTRKSRRLWLGISLALVILTLLILWLEWLGSEQEITEIEESVEIPQTQKGAGS